MRPIPTPLKIVAWIFILTGIYSAIDFVVSLFYSRISINFGVLAIFIGYRLLRLDSRSHSWALFLTWIGQILTPITALIFLILPGELKVFGVSYGQAPPGLGFLCCFVAFAFVRWQYKVLNSDKIRKLFI